jgi:predicted nucleotidyltransferase
MPPPRVPSRELREEALKLLERRGAFLDLARELTELMRRENIPGVIIGGIAVVLHGYVRTTHDIDVFIDQPLT